MRSISRLLVLAPVMGLCCAALTQAPKQPTITINSKSQNFSFGEPIKVHVVLKNTTSQSFSIFRSPGGARGDVFFSASVTGPDGNPAPLTKYGEAIKKHNIPPQAPITKTVAPGEAIDENIDVGRQFDMNSAGIYVIQMSRASPLDPALTLKSNTLTINVGD